MNFRYVITFSLLHIYNKVQVSAVCFKNDSHRLACLDNKIPKGSLLHLLVSIVQFNLFRRESPTLLLEFRRQTLLPFLYLAGNSEVGQHHITVTFLMNTHFDVANVMSCTLRLLFDRLLAVHVFFLMHPLIFSTLVCVEILVSIAGKELEGHFFDAQFWSTSLRLWLAFLAIDIVTKTD